MDIDAIRQERQKWLEWKNIAPLRKILDTLPSIEATLRCEDTIRLEADIPKSHKERIHHAAWQMRPWRKGPFDLFGVVIESEWQSSIKYNLLEPFFDLEGKDVADIGCNNGYYMFRFLSQRPKSVTGFDPSPLFRTQFDLVNLFARTDILYELLGVEHLPFYPKKFDTIFCLGVLYHRSDPVATLKALKAGLKEGGEIYLDTLYIEGEDPVALVPGVYAKMRNVYYIPTVAALENWTKKAGLGMEVLAKRPTDPSEQRKTPWILGQSLEDFLDPKDSQKTVEGYPAPRRLYVRLKRR